MAIDNNRIILGLPALPSDELPAQLYSDFLVVHRAIRNLLDGVSRLSGIDPPAEDEWSQLPVSATLLSGNLTRMYPIATEAIAAGQAVNLIDSGGLKARLASANSASTLAHGIATTAALAGSPVEMNWLRALVSSVGGMTTGALYWLSPVAGSIQDVAPTVAGTIQQPIGLAASPIQLIMDISLSYKQN